MQPWNNTAVKGSDSETVTTSDNVFSQVSYNNRAVFAKYIRDVIIVADLQKIRSDVWDNPRHIIV